MVGISNDSVLEEGLVALSLVDWGATDVSLNPYLNANLFCDSSLFCFTWKAWKQTLGCTVGNFEEETQVLQLAILSVNVICLVSVQETSNLIICSLFISTIKNLDFEKIYKEYKIKGKQKGKKLLTRSAKYWSRIKYHSVSTERIFLPTHQIQALLLRILWPII